jgi:hypothetical protein
LPTESDQERPVIGDEVGEQANEEKKQKYPERPKTPPVGAKGGKPALGKGRHLETEDSWPG